MLREIIQKLDIDKYTKLMTVGFFINFEYVKLAFKWCNYKEAIEQIIVSSLEWPLCSNQNGYDNNKMLKISVQFSSVAQSYPTLCDLMDCSTPAFPVHHQLTELTQTHVHRVGDAIQPSHPLSSPSPPALNPSQHQGLFQWINSSHQVVKVLEL